MHGGAVTLARQLLASELRPEVLLATDMLDLAAFLGLARHRCGLIPAVLYMHENQLTYPAMPDDASWSASRRRRAAARDVHYGFVNITSALAADRVLWNSDYHRRSFLSAVGEFLRQFPDYREADVVESIADRSEVLPLGLDLQSLDAARPDAAARPRPRLVWNHRWEHDKAPETFFCAVDALLAKGLDFELVLLGQRFVRDPPVCEQARQRLGDRIAHSGYVPSREEYARWLWNSDVVVSTARHEFFGAAVAEATYCRCWPVLPDRLSYPELVPRAYHELALYHDFDELVAKLTLALSAAADGKRPPPALRQAMAQYDWTIMSPRYDALLTRVRVGAAADGAGPPV